jgi:hypothetical protein
LHTKDIECGNDLFNGIASIEDAREHLKLLKNTLIKMDCLDNFRDGILVFKNNQRDILKSKLQYFIKIVLFYLVGCEKTYVRIHFDGDFIQPR